MTWAHQHGFARENLQETLRGDHQRLEALFQLLLAAFRANARDEAARLWTEFDTRLRIHLALEEEHIFPEFAKVDASEAKALAEEHIRIRALLTELDICVDLHTARQSTIDDLERMLRTHAAREDALMYRWAEVHTPASRVAAIHKRVLDTVQNLRRKS